MPQPRAVTLHDRGDEPRHLRIAQIGADRIDRGIVQVRGPIGRGIEIQRQLLDLLRDHGAVAARRSYQSPRRIPDRAQPCLARDRNRSGLGFLLRRLVAGNA